MPLLGFGAMAAWYDYWIGGLERNTMAPLREQYAPQVRGPRVLDVATGTGPNLQYYPAGLRVTCVDLEDRMLAEARKKGDARGDELQVEYVAANVAKLPFDDNTFDSVFSFDCFCSVEDPLQGMRELRRVVKPGGEILFVEHYRQDGDEAWAWGVNALATIGTLFIKPLVGASLTRDTERTIADAGLVVEEKVRHTRMFRFLRCNPNKE